MAQPLVRVNNFIKGNDQPFVDLLSKIFVFCEFALGLNRIPVFGKSVLYFAFTFLYDIIIICVVLYTRITYVFEFDREGTKLIEYLICCFLGLFLWRKLRRYYEELQKFDTEVGCRPKISKGSINMMYQMVFAILTYIAIFFYYNCLPQLPLYLLHMVENHYYGHLVEVLLQRLKLINFNVEETLKRRSATTRSDDIKYLNETSRFEMTKILDYYNIIVEAYDLLTDAIKWQLLFIIVISFVATLWLCHYVAVTVILIPPQTIQVWHTSTMWLYASMVVLETAPLFAPCVTCDQIRAEVQKLRELLAYKLFESKRDKIGRNIARALLALTETRNLSFSLLRMMKISISLPFSFFGLLATYLVICLQFEKVLLQHISTSKNISLQNIDVLNYTKIV